MLWRGGLPAHARWISLAYAGAGLWDGICMGPCWSFGSAAIGWSFGITFFLISLSSGFLATAFMGAVLRAAALFAGFFLDTVFFLGTAFFFVAMIRSKYEDT